MMRSRAAAIYRVFKKFILNIKTLKLVLEQAAARGVQLKADRVDFEAKWRHYSLNDTAVAIHPPSSAPADSICVSARA